MSGEVVGRQQSQVRTRRRRVRMGKVVKGRAREGIGEVVHQRSFQSQERTRDIRRDMEGRAVEGRIVGVVRLEHNQEKTRESQTAGKERNVVGDVREGRLVEGRSGEACFSGASDNVEYDKFSVAPNDVEYDNSVECVQVLILNEVIKVKRGQGRCKAKGR